MQFRKIYHYLIPVLILNISAGNPSPEMISENKEDDILTAIASLRLNAADSLISRELLTDPFASDLVYLDNYNNFIQCLIDGDSLSYEKYFRLASDRIKLIKSRKPDGADKQFYLSSIYLQSSVLYAAQGAIYQAGRHFLVASRQQQHMERSFPDDYRNDKLGGLLEVMTSQLPPEYSRALRWTGQEGDEQNGLKRLHEYYQKASGAERLEAHILTLYAGYLTGIQTDSLPGRQDNILISYIGALYAVRSGKSGEAVQILSSISQDTDQIPLRYIEFLLGEAKLNLLMSGADEHFLHFLKDYRGSNYRKTCWHKLSWYYYLEGNMSAYQDAKDNLVRDGRTLVDADKQAMNESGDPLPLNVSLLKARLLFDGGQYPEAIEAMEALDSLESNPLSAVRDSLELVYRKGRIYQATGMFPEALEAFEKVISLGQDKSWYFASNAALQSGFIHEQNGNYERARQSYQLCLEINGSGYKNSIGQKARQGLKRADRVLSEN